MKGSDSHVQAGSTPGRSPLRGGYLVRNPLLVGGLAAIDTLLRAWPGGRRSAPLAAPPRRVLLSLGGHLGDVVIASATLPLLKRIWPEAEIGVLLGSWSRPVLEGHPLVARIHTLDHWKLNRSASGSADRLRKYRSTRRKALREISAVGYDVALDLYPFFPNTVPLLRRAGIPVRVGYASGGFSPLLTHAVPWRDEERHLAEYHRELLSLLDPRFREMEGGYSLPEPASPGFAGAGAGEYLVLHMGSGLKLKEWPRDRWRALADRLLAEGHTLVFTGSGAEQAEEAERVAGGRPGCHNLCDRLSWDGFVRTLAEARLVVSVDSVAGHLAAAVETPVVVLMSGMNRIGQWRPLGERVATVTHPVPCAPCHLSRGCESMACVRGITVGEVLRAVRGELGSGEPAQLSGRAGS